MAPRIAAAAAILIILSAAGAGQTAALPPAEPFLRDAREAFARSQEEWHRYAYTERRTELHLNPFGRMGTGATRITEVRPSPIPRLIYRRVIERGGEAVPQDELDRQDAEYRARAARLADDDGFTDEQLATRRHEVDMLARKRARMMIDDVANALVLTIARRDTRHGRPSIVVSFSPRPGARPMTREGQFATQFKGELWIDEASHELTDVDAVSVDDVSFGGFIGKVYKGTTAVVERKNIGQGVWMPTRLAMTGDIRALFRKAHIDQVIEWFDYRLMP